MWESDLEGLRPVFSGQTRRWLLEPKMIQVEISRLGPGRRDKFFRLNRRESLSKKAELEAKEKALQDAMGHVWLSRPPKPSRMLLTSRRR